MQTKQQQIIYAPQISLLLRVQIKFFVSNLGLLSSGQKKDSTRQWKLVDCGKVWAEKGVYGLWA